MNNYAVVQKVHALTKTRDDGWQVLTAIWEFLAGLTTQDETVQIMADNGIAEPTNVLREISRLDVRAEREIA